VLLFLKNRRETLQIINKIMIKRKINFQRFRYERKRLAKFEQSFKFCYMGQKVGSEFPLFGFLKFNSISQFLNYSI